MHYPGLLLTGDADIGHSPFCSPRLAHCSADDSISTSSQLPIDVQEQHGPYLCALSHSAVTTPYHRFTYNTDVLIIESTHLAALVPRDLQWSSPIQSLPRTALVGRHVSASFDPMDSAKVPVPLDKTLQTPIACIARRQDTPKTLDRFFHLASLDLSVHQW